MASPRVLVGATDGECGDQLATTLAAAGLEHVRVPDDAGLLAMVEDYRPDLVIIDADQLGPNVAETGRRIREARRHDLLPILVINGAAHATGDAVTDFMCKPVDPTLLRSRIRSLTYAAETLRKLHTSEMRLARLQRIARLGSWVRSLETDALTLDPELRRILDLPPESARDSLCELLASVHPDDRAAVEATMQSRLPHRLEYRVVLERAGLTRTLKQEAWLTQDEPGGALEMIGTTLDITELKDAQDKIAKLAYFDVLTGLPNRAFLREYLQLALARAKRSQCSVGVLALDLDYFKRVNDSLGHPAGDALLNVVAQRISGAVRTSDSVMRNQFAQPSRASGAESTVARIGGDEFIVILGDLRVPEDAAIAARRIVEALAQPVQLDSVQVVTGCSVGIAIFPDNGSTPNALIKNADTALYHAKEQGRGTYHFFSEGLGKRARHRLDLETGLRAAITNDELQLHYQPKIDLATGQLAGCEALVRWPTGDGEFVPPGQFIPIAEDTGMILELGRWVIHNACRQASGWITTLGRPIPIAVNVSARQLASPGFEATIAEALAAHRLPAHLLEIEITEGAIMRDLDATTRLLQRVRDSGVRIALDDFGTGYSSLSHLLRLPIHTLKIDRAFVRELGSAQPGNTSVAITAAVVAMSRALSLRVVAEGVETREQLDFLTAHGCDEVQGYLFARPMPREAFEAWASGFEPKPSSVHAAQDRPTTLNRTPEPSIPRFAGQG